MKKLFVILSIIALAAFVSTAVMAQGLDEEGFSIVGDPVWTNSWNQNWTFNGSGGKHVASIEFWISSPGYFSPTAAGFICTTSGSDWAEKTRTPVLLQDGWTFLKATGTGTSGGIQFYTHFQPVPDNIETAFTFKAKAFDANGVALSACSYDWNKKGDLSWSQRVKISDVNALMNLKAAGEYWEDPVAETVSNEVPEPMSIMLGIMGLGSIAGLRILRRK